MDIWVDRSPKTLRSRSQPRPPRDRASAELRTVDSECELALRWWSQALLHRGVAKGRCVWEGYNSLLTVCSEFISETVATGTIARRSRGLHAHSFPANGDRSSIRRNSIGEEIAEFFEFVSDAVDSELDKEGAAVLCDTEALKCAIDWFREIRSRWALEVEAHQFLATQMP